MSKPWRVARLLSPESAGERLVEPLTAAVVRDLLGEWTRTRDLMGWPKDAVPVWELAWWYQPEEETP
jgi:hypothetical protein